MDSWNQEEDVDVLLGGNREMSRDLILTKATITLLCETTYMYVTYLISKCI